MSTVHFTEAQRRAIETVGQGVLVSAAAGSGKTAVLAERCAYLICDAPAPYRCEADQLLVLTFTEAAAAEMRSRIVAALRARWEAAPNNLRLREQLSLIEIAQISTIHSFCLWLIRRWFSDVGLDPTASVIDEHEAGLIRKEVLDTLLTELYAADRPSKEPLGDVRPSPARVGPVEDHPAISRSSARLGEQFISLVDAYGLGEDRDIVEFVLRLQAFVASLPDPQSWLQRAVDRNTRDADGVILQWLQALKVELTVQLEYCEALVEMLRQDHPVTHFYGGRIENYAQSLSTWLAEISRVLDGPPGGGTEPVGVLERYDGVRQLIAKFEDRSRAPSIKGDFPPDVRARREAASKLWSGVKKNLFGERLKNRFALFTVDEWRQGLRTIAPFAETLVDLVRAFDDRYAARKRHLNVLDFSDLERFAYELLRGGAGDAKLSAPATALRQRFVHVLVDEFQDVNPLQQAILTLVSRDTEPDRPGNLFAVGDVKQSIYRFRLAEPTLFLERLHRSRVVSSGNTAIPLQHNFRSLPPILDAVNLVFSRLMRPGLGEINYDADAELRTGRKVDGPLTPSGVELHLLERRWRNTSVETAPADFAGPAEDPEHAVNHDDPLDTYDHETDADGFSVLNANDAEGLHQPARWSPIEREAYLIGSRIREWIAGGQADGNGEPLRYRDCAVLLRATKFNADRIAAVLQSMGIPAFSSVGGSLFGSLEVRDVLAALDLLDNTRQDIPLASVLRSGILSPPFSEDELVEIRCEHRDVPFHEAVQRYVATGANLGLKSRLEDLWRKIERYRQRVRRRPLTEVLWKLYDQESYMAYVGGLPNGMQRRANLLKLHELARTFGTFRRQGLSRFLRFIHSLEENEEDIGAAHSMGESEDVVRIMSIHQAKGQEFPLVFLAGLGTGFNLGDRRGRMIYERQAGLGLKVVDPDELIEYPSVSHQLAAMEVEHNTRQEELRILYVAMTRARDRFVMVGSINGLQTVLHDARMGKPSLTRLSFITAKSPLDWLLPIFTATNEGQKQPIVSVHGHDLDEMSMWRLDETSEPSVFATRHAVSRMDPLPGNEPIAHDDPGVAEVIGRLDFVYPHLAMSSVPSVVAAGAFKHSFDSGQNDQQSGRLDASPNSSAFTVPPSKYGTQPTDTATHRGTVTHRLLQHLDFGRAKDREGIFGEWQRLVSVGLAREDDRSLVDWGSIEWFVTTQLAEAIRDAGSRYRREISYLASDPPTVLDQTITGGPDDFVLVRGVVDGILPVTGGLEIVDFKTDRIEASQAGNRAEAYRRQMEFYCRAVSSMWRKPVGCCWLVFLHPRVIVTLSDMGKPGPSARVSPRRTA